MAKAPGVGVAVVIARKVVVALGAPVMGQLDHRLLAEGISGAPLRIFGDGLVVFRHVAHEI